MKKAELPISDSASNHDAALLGYLNGRLEGLRVNRWSWWTHWRELADYFLPRRYRWIVTPNMMSRGSPIQQHILDSTGVIAARNLASGLLSGKSSPTRRWLKLRLGNLDSTQTTPESLWLAEVERILYLIFQESNFYNAIAVYYYDLVIFGTATMIIYEDYENVINCYNACAGEYYVDIDAQYRPTILYRQFTMTVYAMVQEYGYENCSEAAQSLWNSGQKTGADLTREFVIAHAIEPNNDGKGRSMGIDDKYEFRELYWEYGGGSQSGQNNTNATSFLRKRGYHEQPQLTCRWDLVSNDAYGRSPAMDALGDQKQLQLETRRKAQGLDKMVNPPLVADSRLKNQPASLLPGGMTYLDGMMSSQKPGIGSIYDTKFPINELSEDLKEVRARLGKIFYNDILQTASQFETRSNVTEMEWNMRKSESMIMLGPALERVDNEALKVAVERVYGIASRANIFPPAPDSLQGKELTIEFVSMLSQAQSAAQATGIERTLAMGGNLVGVDPAAMDNIDIDYAIDKYSQLLGNDPKLIRSPEALQAIRGARQAQQEAQRKAAMAEQYAKSAKNLAAVDVGGGVNAVQAMTGGA